MSLDKRRTLAWVLELVEGPPRHKNLHGPEGMKTGEELPRRQEENQEGGSAQEAKQKKCFQRKGVIN